MKRDRILFLGFTLKKVVANRIASFLILQILKHIQLLRFSHICCSAMDATQSIHPAWGPIMFSTSPVSHLQHKISRAFDTNKYRRPTRLIRTLSNTFKRHSSSSVSFHFLFFTVLAITQFSMLRERKLVGKRNFFLHKSAQVTLQLTIDVLLAKRAK